MDEIARSQIIREYYQRLTSIGGKARAAALSPERRSAIAKKAARASAKVRKLKARKRKEESRKNSLR
jgi:hypothetical protein